MPSTTTRKEKETVDFENEFIRIKGNYLKINQYKGFFSLLIVNADLLP